MLFRSAALKQAIQITYQLEENELAVTVPPDDARGTRILFYEAAEGGAGVLRRIVQEPSALLKVARNAIDVCHYDPDTGGNYKRGRFSKEDCALACYDCLMTYGNQRDHKSLDRHAAVKVLQKLQQCTVGPSPVRLPRAELVEQLLRCCQNDLERDWVRYLDTRGYHLPNKAQHHIPDCNLRADFFYESKNHAIFVDGPMHREPDVKRRDAEQEEAMLNAGIGFVRFKVGTDWDAIIANYPNLFGSPK